MSATRREEWRLVRQPSYALNLDGTDDRVRLPDDLFTEAASFSAGIWLRPEDGTLEERVITLRDDIRFILAIGRNADREIATWTSGTWRNAGADGILPAGEWSHVGVAYDAATSAWTVYLNGSPVLTFTQALATENVGNSYLGTQTDGTGTNYDGDLDDFRLYRRTLTAEEFGGLTDGDHITGDLAYWLRLNEGAGTTVADSSPERNANATLELGPVWKDEPTPANIETQLFDIQTAKAFNRYASHFSAKMDDPWGTKADQYPRGQRARAQVSTDGGQTWQTRQAGFVQNPDDGGGGLGTGQFTALFIGYDHFLRREPVYQTFSGVTVMNALQTIIQNHTPAEWVPGNVTVSNNTTVSRQFVGEKADEVLSWLATVSGNEEYGVNSDFEFYFRPRETRSAPSNVQNGDWFAYDLPTEGRHAVNSVRVFFGDGDTTPRSSVIVEDRVAQRTLRESLDASRRVVLGHDVHYPEIDNRAAARAKGQEILNQRSPVLTGTVETFERFDYEPGDVFRLEIPEKGIDTTFAVAEVQHSWTGATTLKVAQNTGNVADMLKAMSDDIIRVDLRDSDPDATFTRYIDLNLGVTVSIEAEARQRTIEESSFVAGFGSVGDSAGLTLTDETGVEPQAGFNYAFTSAVGGTGAATTDALNIFRDVWQGETPPALTKFKVGTDGTAAVETDTNLTAPIGGLRDVEAVFPSGDYAVEFQASISPGGELTGQSFREFGFFDGAGTMHNRATVPEPVTHGSRTRTSLFVRFTVDTDRDEVGVVTNTGQRRLRDMYVSSTVPVAQFVDPAVYSTSARAYGTGTTPESESNTALATKLGEKPLTHDDFGTAKDVATMELLTTEANGTTLAEFGDENDVNELLTRAVFEPLDKTTQFALVSNLGFRVRPVIL